MGNKERQKENANKWIGVEKKNASGLTMTISAYRTYKDIDVVFEDGVTKEHVALNTFKLGKIAHPDKNKVTHDKVSREGLKALNNDGEEMTIIRYGSSVDIDVSFSDGSISRHKTFDSFLNGSIKRPTAYNDKKCEGLSIKATNGQMFTVLKYHSHNDIECKFEDGTIVHGKSLKSVLNGHLVNPNHKRPSKHLGLIITAANGLRCKVTDVKDGIAYYTFEDGEKGQMIMSSFLQKMIRHKHLGAKGDGNFHGIQTKKRFVFRMDDKTYYECTLPDGTKDILTPQEMLKIQGIDPVF